MGAGDGYGGGDTEEAGLPNIEGEFVAACRDGITKGSNLGKFSGTFYPISDTTSGYNSIDTNVGISSGQSRYGFKASSFNSIYGNSSTVQPPAYYVYIWGRAS